MLTTIAEFNTFVENLAESEDKKILIDLLNEYNNELWCLKRIHGKVPGNYFLTESCASPNTKIKRGNEGLFVHHDAELYFNNLNDKAAAKSYNYNETQTANNLTYCTATEHLKLHLIIDCIRTLYNKLHNWQEEIAYGNGVMLIYKPMTEVDDYLRGKNTRLKPLPWQCTAYANINWKYISYLFDTYYGLLDKIDPDKRALWANIIF